MNARWMNWLNERWPVRAVKRWGLEEAMPGGDSFWYCFGSSLLFVFTLQVATGIMQLFYYVPVRDHAYQSVMYLRREVPFGWLIHGLHYWGSNAFIVLLGLHISRVFIWGAYKKPRQLIWMVGVLLLSSVLALSFIGALLPWDELGYWAAEVGTSIAGTTPVIGAFLKMFLRGGAAMTQMTLSRFFVLHVMILPSLLGALILIHLVAFRQFGISGPWKEEKRKTMGRFWPDQVLKDLIVISAIFLALVGLSAFWPAPVTGPADEVDNTYFPKPEWQFLFLYQFIKLFKGRLEPVGTVGVPLLLFLVFILLPFYDRGRERNPLRRLWALAGGAAMVAWLITYTILGHLSNPGGAAAGGSLSISAALSPGARNGAQLFQKQGCMACHTVNGRGGSIGPNLSNEGTSGRTPQWLAQQIRYPKSHDPKTVMPSFSSLSKTQINNLVEFLGSLGKSEGGKEQAGSPDPPPPAGTPRFSPSPGGKKAGAEPEESPSRLAERGKKLFPTLACIGCHTIHGKGGTTGPDLSLEGEKGHSVAWIKQQIRNPKSHDPETVMPSFDYLGGQKIDELAAYLESLTKEEKKEASEKEEAEPAPQPEAKGEEVKREVSEKKPGQAAFLVGSPSRETALFDKNCARCHGPEGKDNVPNPGSDDGAVPPLNPIDRSIYSPDPVVFSRNIDIYIQHGSVPSGPHPKESMPAFGDKLMLTQQMIAQIEAYILSLNGVNRAAIMTPGMKPRDFFIVAAFVFGLVWIVIACFWSGIVRNAPCDAPPETNGKPEGEAKRAYLEIPGEAEQPVCWRRIVFGLVIAISVVIVGGALYYIFSRFVTSKPAPHVPAVSSNAAAGKADG